MYQLKEALLDPLTWAFVFYALTADIPNGGISNFFSQLVSIAHLTFCTICLFLLLMTLGSVAICPSFLLKG
jgi:hypothetical protein